MSFVWLQASISLVVWIACGYFVNRQVRKSYPQVLTWPRWLSPVLMLMGGVFLFGTIALVAQSGGLKNGLMLPWAWLIVTVIGVLFVTLQTLSAIIAFGNIDWSETTNGKNTSNSEEKSE